MSWGERKVWPKQKNNHKSYPWQPTQPSFFSLNSFIRQQFHKCELVSLSLQLAIKQSFFVEVWTVSWNPSANPTTFGSHLVLFMHILGSTPWQTCGSYWRLQHPAELGTCFQSSFPIPFFRDLFHKNSNKSPHYYSWGLPGCTSRQSAQRKKCYLTTLTEGAEDMLSICTLYFVPFSSLSHIMGFCCWQKTEVMVVGAHCYAMGAKPRGAAHNLVLRIHTFFLADFHSLSNKIACSVVVRETTCRQNCACQPRLPPCFSHAPRAGGRGHWGRWLWTWLQVPGGTAVAVGAVVAPLGINCPFCSLR